MLQAGISRAYISYRHVSLAGVHLTGVHLTGVHLRGRRIFIPIEQTTRPAGVLCGMGWGDQVPPEWFRLETTTHSDPRCRED
jgi:hypothetical protein